MKLSPGRFSFINASYTVSWTAMFRDGMNMHMHMFYISRSCDGMGGRRFGKAELGPASEGRR